MANYGRIERAANKPDHQFGTTHEILTDDECCLLSEIAAHEDAVFIGPVTNSVGERSSWFVTEDHGDSINQQIEERVMLAIEYAGLGFLFKRKA